MQRKTGLPEKIKRKPAAVILLALGLIFLAYFGVWSTGVLLWSFDIGVCFILAVGLVLSILGLLLWQKSFHSWTERHRSLVNAALILVSAFILSFVVVEGFLIQAALQDDSDMKSDFVIIPGAAIVENRPSRALRHRLDKALTYIRNNPNATVIVSGAKGTDKEFSEAEVMKQYLMDNGIDGHRILKEERAVNSAQNISYSKEMIDWYPPDRNPKFMIVTNDFHIFRMKLLTKVQRMDAYGISVPIHYSVAPICYSKEYFSLLKLLITGFQAE